MTTPEKARLVAMDFSRDIARLTQGFTGRKWLFDQLDGWLERGGAAATWSTAATWSATGRRAS